jgi:hypothetical protein
MPLKGIVALHRPTGHRFLGRDQSPDASLASIFNIPLRLEAPPKIPPLQSRREYEGRGQKFLKYKASTLVIGYVSA